MLALFLMVPILLQNRHNSKTGLEDAANTVTETRHVELKPARFTSSRFEALICNAFLIFRQKNRKRKEIGTAAVEHGRSKEKRLSAKSDVSFRGGDGSTKDKHSAKKKFIKGGMERQWKVNKRNFNEGPTSENKKTRRNNKDEAAAVQRPAHASVFKHKKMGRRRVKQQ